MTWEWFSSMLSPVQWAWMLFIPPAIIALYFLKLRRRPMEVSSTYLWRRTIEDLHVNSLWQRLRQSLLLYLQLLLVAALILACLRPSWQKRAIRHERVVLLIDQSASMSATDVEPSRLAEARRKAHEVVTQLRPGDVAMVVAFSDRARVEQSFTNNLKLLHRAIDAIRPTARTSDIREALQVAAGLANPGRSATDAGDIQVADPLPADVFILSDGNFTQAPDFSWGNLRPTYVSIGTATPNNLGLTSFGAAELTDRRGWLRAFAEIRNYGSSDAVAEVELWHQGAMRDVSRQRLPAGEAISVEFELAGEPSGVVEARLTTQDVLSADNAAWTVLDPPEPTRVLLVTDGLAPVERALQTPDSLKQAELAIRPSSSLGDKEFGSGNEAESYDLVIFDRCQPRELPSANTLFFASTPPGESWKLTPLPHPPQIIDFDVDHPLLRYMSLSDVQIAGGSSVAGPEGKRILIDSDGGPIAVAAGREGFEDIVLGFGILTSDGQGAPVANTDWPIRLSFPVFFRNLLSWSRPRTTSEGTMYRPGDTVVLGRGSDRERGIRTPSGRIVRVAESTAGRSLFFETEELGPYDDVINDRGGTPRFAVNLMDVNESDLAPQATFDTDWSQVTATEGTTLAPEDGWRYLAAMAVAVLLAEWYVYNRRVFV